MMRKGEFKRRYLYMSTALVLSTALLETPAASQAAEANERQANDPIVVTATRRETNLQETAIAITALTGELIEQTRIQNVEDTLFLVPNTNFINAKGNSASYASIRGAIGGDEAPGVDLPVVFFIDDVYYGSAASAYPDFYDVQQIEVLRGPQGTTFGRNVTGGAIVVRSREPVDYFEAALTGSIGTDDRYEGRGFINAPLGENAAARLAFSARNYGGSQRNLTTGASEAGQEFYSARAMFAFDLTDNVSALINANATLDRSNNRAFNFFIIGDGPSTPGFAGVVLPTDPDLSAGNVSPANKSENFGISARISADFDWATLTSISAYRNLDSHRIDDADGTALNIHTQNDTQDDKLFSQELRLTSAPGNFEWIVGAYYLHQESKRVAAYNNDAIPGTALGFIIPNHLDARLTQDITTTSFAPYFEGVLHFTDELALRAGARYTWDKKSGFTEHLGVNPITTFPVDYNVAYKENWSAFTPRVILEFSPTDNLFLYAGASRGYRGGGYTLAGVRTAAAASSPYDPEFVWNYEAGIRSQFWDDRITANVTFFEQRTTDLQVRTFVGSVFSFTNAGRARSRGVEIEFNAKPTDNIDLGFSYGYIDAEYTRFEGCSTGVDCSGNQYALVPEQSLTAYVAAQIPLGEGAGELFFRTDFRTRSSVELNAQNSTPAALREMTDVPGIFNGQIGWESEDGSWRATLWGRNLTDKRYVNFGVDLGIYYLDNIPFVPGFTGTEANESVWRVIYNEGRSVGFTLTHNF